MLKGAEATIKKYAPLVIFESGKGASEFYGTEPGELFTFITETLGLSISTLKSFLSKKEKITKEAFEEFFRSGKEYYFVAAK